MLSVQLKHMRIWEAIIYWPSAVWLVRPFTSMQVAQKILALTSANIVINILLLVFFSLTLYIVVYLVGRISITKQQFKYVSYVLKHMKPSFWMQ